MDIVYLCIHGFIDAGYEVFSAWRSREGALAARMAFATGTGGWEWSPTGLLERVVGGGRGREYLDVIPRLVCDEGVPRTPLAIDEQAGQSENEKAQ